MVKTNVTGKTLGSIGKKKTGQVDGIEEGSVYELTGY